MEMLVNIFQKRHYEGISCKWEQDSAVSLSLYLDSVIKNTDNLVHNRRFVSILSSISF